MSEARKVKLKNMIAYGVGDLYGGGSFFIIGTLSMFYLINVVGLSPLYAGLIPGLSKIWDAISDPLMGYISDNTKSRFGRRRLYFLLAILPVAVSFILIWLPVKFDTEFFTFLYYLIAYLFFFTCSTFVMIPYNALSAEMSTDFTERNKLTSTRMIFSIVSTLIAGGLAKPIVDSFADPSRGYQVMGLIFAVFYALPWIFVFLGTWELPQLKHESDLNMNVFKNFGSIFRNKTFRIHIGMYVCAYAAMDVLMAWLLFYLTDYIQKPEFFAIGLPIIVISEILVLPLYAMFSNKKGHSKSFMLGLSIWVIAMLLMFFQTHDTPNILLILNCILVGVGLSAAVVIPYQILPFVSDVDELMTTKRRAGTYSGAMTLTRKLIQGAIVLPLLGVILTLIGYVQPTPVQMNINKAGAQIVQIANKNLKAYTPASIAEAQKKTDWLASAIVKSAEQVDDQKIKQSLIESALQVSKTSQALTATADKDTCIQSLTLIKLSGENIVSQLKIQQTRSTANMMRYMFVLTPVLLMLLGIFLATRFKITPHSHKILIQEIERLKNGGSKAKVDPEAKRVCEELSGAPYEKLYCK